jgi:hypothetical protein
LRVDALAHDALEAERRANQAETRKRARVRPRRCAPVVRKAPLVAFLDGDGRSDGHERLDERAEEEPRARLRAHAIAEASYEGAADEREHRRERLLVRDVEGRVAVPRRALEQARERDRQLPARSAHRP